MKRKFTTFDIARGNLRHRKRQYILLTLGIVLAIYFAAVSLLFGYGLYTSVVERREDQYGEYDVALYGLDNASWEGVAADDTIARLGRVEILAYAVTDDAGGTSFSIAKFDDEAIELTHRRLVEGAFPKETGQIALSRAALARLRVVAGIGDTVTLSMRIPDGEDFLPDTVDKEYTLVGVLYDQKVPLAYSSATGDSTDYAVGMVSPAEQIAPGGRGAVAAFGSLSAQNGDTFQHWSHFRDDYSLTVDMNWNMSQYSLDAEDYEMLYTGVFIMIVGMVLVLACCLGIVNAFSANLDARRRQIGMLRAVGATKRQIRRIFRRETLIIALTAAPVGIVLAVLSVYGAFALLGGDFHFILNIWVILGVAAVGILCIVVASGIPLRRAGAVSPMQAIRDVDMVRAVKKKAVKSKTQFDVARLVASRANRIYKSRKIGIAVMLAAGMLLFSAVVYIVVPAVESAFIEAVNAQHYQLYGPYMTRNDVLVYGYHAPGLTEGDRWEVMSLPLVAEMEGEKDVYIKILPEEITPYATQDGWDTEYEYLATGPRSDPDTSQPMRWYEKANEMYLEGKAKYGYTGDYLNIICTAMEEDCISQLESHVYEGRIDIDKLRTGEEVLLVAPQAYDLYYTPHDGGVYSLSMRQRGVPGERVITSQKNDMFRAGDPINMSLLYTDGQEQWDQEREYVIWPEDAVRVDNTAKIGALLDFSDDSGDLRVVTSFAGLAFLGYDVPYQRLSVTLSETPDPETEAYIQEALTQITSRIPGARVHSNIESARESRQLSFQLISVALSLIILMMAITASMMNNTLSAHIRAGRRGIGTLRAVGVSDRIIFRSYLYQLLYLFVWGGGIGYGLSILFAVLINDQMILGVQNAPIPFWQPVLFTALLFGICLLNVRARLRSVLRESVIGNIRVL